MYNEYLEKKQKINAKMIKVIIDYYKYLYINYDVKSVSEIANDLEVSCETIRRYIEVLYDGKNMYGKYSKISLMILLCTKFGNKSPYYNAQKELSNILKKREIVKLLKEYKANQKNKSI